MPLSKCASCAGPSFELFEVTSKAAKVPKVTTRILPVSIILAHFYIRVKGICFSVPFSKLFRKKR